jgi:hypothetical protein
MVYHDNKMQVGVYELGGSAHDEGIKARGSSISASKPAQSKPVQFQRAKFKAAPRRIVSQSNPFPLKLNPATA